MHASELPLQALKATISIRVAWQEISAPGQKGAMASMQAVLPGKCYAVRSSATMWMDDRAALHMMSMNWPSAAPSAKPGWGS